MNPAIHTSPVLNISATAYAVTGVCAMSSNPSFATISRLAVSITVSDPHHRLFSASGLVQGTRPDSITVDDIPKVISIQSPSVELVFEAGYSAGITANTSIHLDHRDPWLLFGQMQEAGLVDVDGGRQSLTVELLYYFVRHHVLSLVGFESLSIKPGRQPALSADAAALVSEMGEALHDPLRFNAVLKACLERPGLCIDYWQVEREVRTHAICQKGLHIDDYLPISLGFMRRNSQSECEQYPHHALKASHDYWNLSACQDPVRYSPQPTNQHDAR